MATDAQVSQMAMDSVAISNSVKAAYQRCKEFVAHNSVMAVDWAGLPPDPVSGTDALPADISNVIYAMTKLIAMWEGAGVDAVNYGQSFDKLANPLV